MKNSETTAKSIFTTLFFLRRALALTDLRMLSCSTQWPLARNEPLETVGSSCTVPAGCLVSSPEVEDDTATRNIRSCKPIRLWAHRNWGYAVSVILSTRSLEVIHEVNIVTRDTRAFTDLLNWKLKVRLILHIHVELQLPWSCNILLHRYLKYFTQLLIQRFWSNVKLTHWYKCLGSSTRTPTGLKCLITVEINSFSSQSKYKFRCLVSLRSGKGIVVITQTFN